jgi:hypothetical protein
MFQKVLVHANKTKKTVNYGVLVFGTRQQNQLKHRQTVPQNDPSKHFLAANSVFMRVQRPKNVKTESEGVLRGRRQGRALGS